eukprot:gene29345-12440_t
MLLPVSTQITALSLLFFCLALLIVNDKQPAAMDAHAHHDHSTMSEEAMPMSHDHIGHVGMDGMPMPMYFMNTFHTTLWFRSWTTTNVTQYMLSIVALIIFAVIHEGIFVVRAQMLAKMSPKPVFDEAGAPLLNTNRHQKSSLGLRLTMMSMYMLSMCTSYLLMLAVMTL